jgi:hypothetical protein
MEKQASDLNYIGLVVWWFVNLEEWKSKLLPQVSLVWWSGGLSI